MTRRMHYCEKDIRATKIANCILYSLQCRDVNVYVIAFSIYAVQILTHCCFVWAHVCACVMIVILLKMYALVICL